MTENETENVQPKKSGSSLKTYIIYAIVVLVLSYAYTYATNIWKYNKQFKNMEAALNVSVAEETWQTDSSVPLLDMGTFQMAVPQDRVQMVSLIPGQGSLWVVLDNLSIQITQPSSAAMAAESIKKAQQENPEDETLRKMSINDFNWHKQAALVTKLGYFAFAGMDQVARGNYLNWVNYKATLPVNGRGLVIFNTDKINGIMHKGALEPEGENKLVTAVVQVWDKQRDIIQEITMNCQADKYDSAIADLKNIAASISYEGKETAGIVQQVQTCFEKIKTMPKFVVLKVNTPEQSTQPSQNVQPAPEMINQPAPASQEQKQN